MTNEVMLLQDIKTVDQIDEQIELVMMQGKLCKKALTALDLYIQGDLPKYRAYEQAYKPRTQTAKKNITINATHFFNRPHVKRMVELTRKRLVLDGNVTREELISKLKEVYRQALASGNQAVAVQCIDKMSRISGLQSGDININTAPVTFNLNFSPKTPVGLREIEGEVINPDDLL